MMRSSLALALLAGCASASSQGVADGPPGPGRADAKIYLDSSSVEQPPDASPDAARPIDAAMPPPMDAPACTPHTTQLLGNPAFDLTPIGTRWTEQDIDSTYPIVTGDTGLNPQSSPYRAWMGGFSGDEGYSNLTDMLYQDVTVPAGTTQLVLTGYYAVATSETDSNVYDTGSVDLIQTDGTPIESILSVTNATVAASWTQISHTFTTNVSGQTVRLRFTTTNDVTNPTSFYFDTLSLKATHCP